jgi:hypothetical protein
MFSIYYSDAYVCMPFTCISTACIFMNRKNKRSKIGRILIHMKNGVFIWNGKSIQKNSCLLFYLESMVAIFHFLPVVSYFK